jgi:formate hydrogenlyase subunit 6/NADH:ubiquinone oxidoreductase subunit I
MIIKLDKYLKHSPLKTIRNIVFKLFITSRNKTLAVELQQSHGALFINYPEAHSDLEGNWNCISCDLCHKICPTQCIVIKTKQKALSLRLDSKTPPASFKIDLALCRQCGLCVDVCPTNALAMSGQYALSAFSSPVELTKI